MIAFKDLFIASCQDVYYQVEEYKYEKLTWDKIEKFDNYGALIIDISYDYSLYIKKWIIVEGGKIVEGENKK